MRSMGQNPTEDEVLNLVIEYDVNGDGTIDFDEFLEMMRKQAEQQDNSAELKEAFKIFDRDGNGYIDASELKKVGGTGLLYVEMTKDIVLRWSHSTARDCRWRRRRSYSAKPIWMEMENWIFKSSLK